jgi:hypothetical protein
LPLLVCVDLGNSRTVTSIPHAVTAAKHTDGKSISPGDTIWHSFAGDAGDNSATSGMKVQPGLNYGDAAAVR